VRKYVTGGPICPLFYRVTFRADVARSRWSATRFSRRAQLGPGVCVNSRGARNQFRYTTQYPCDDSLRSGSSTAVALAYAATRRSSSPFIR
jgi:hypothetical protein